MVTDNNVMGRMRTKPNLPTPKTVEREVTSTKEGVKIYSATVAAKAAQVDLNVDEAAQRLIETAGRQVAGIF